MGLCFHLAMKGIIIAPHPDDEIIGCYRLIKQGAVSQIVYWGKGLSEERRQEALRFCSDFCLNPTFIYDFNDLLTLPDPLFVALPALTDYHPLHRAITSFCYLFLASRFPLIEYTTTMQVSWIEELTPQEQQEKRAWLDRYYPSQRTLWEKAWQYWLFEGYRIHTKGVLHLVSHLVSSYVTD